MDTPLTATVHKKNVHVGGGKTFTMRKPIKLKPAGKRRKILADFRDTYASSSGVSNDVDLKPMAHRKQQIAGADLFTTKKQIVNRASKVANLNTHSVSRCHERALKKGIEESVCSTWSILEDDESYYSLLCLELKQPFLSTQSNVKGYKIKDPDLHSPMSFPGPLFSRREELDDLLDASRLVLNEYYPVPEIPELQFEDDFGFDNDNIIGDEEREVCALAELDKGFANKITEY